MDKIENNVLGFLIQYASTNSYKVLSLADIMSEMNIDNDQAISTIEVLEEQGFIKTKYLDSEDVCLILTNKSIKSTDKDIIERIVLPKHNSKVTKTTVAIIAGLAFAGGLLGSFLGRLLFK